MAQGGSAAPSRQAPKYTTDQIVSTAITVADEKGAEFTVRDGGGGRGFRSCRCTRTSTAANN